MRLLQTPYLLSCIGILPSVAHLSCLWNPEIHAPRHGDGRISIACGKFMVGIGTHERLHIHPDGLRYQGEEYKYEQN